jgi:hypothetical protein
MKAIPPSFWLFAFVLTQLSAQQAPDSNVPALVLPVIELRANGRSGESPLTLARGEPMEVVVTLRHPALLGDETSRNAVVRFTPAKGKWTDDLVLGVVDAAGTPQPSWAFEMVGNAAAVLNLDSNELSNVVYRLPGAATAKLAKGSYTLTARLDGRDGTGYPGVAESPPQDFALVDAQVGVSGAELVERQRWRVEDAILAARGSPEPAASVELARAETEATSLLKAQPQEPLSWVLFARVRETSGDPRSGVLYARAALATWHTKNPDELRPPLDLLDLERRLSGAAAAASPSKATASGESRGPGSVSVTPVASQMHASMPMPAASSDDDEFSDDRHGHWATSAEASSAYGSDRYSARQATGAPNVPHYGDYGEAWASKTPDGTEEWLKLTFAKPVRATAVRVRQTYNPGAISKIEAFAADGRSAVVWSGKDPTAYAKNQIAWFTATFVPPPFPVQTIKLTLDSVNVKGWNEIDAVQLVGDP